VKFTIERLQPNDWGQVRSIYLEGIATGNATFETDAPDWETWNRNHLDFGRFVARDGSATIGWAALSSISSRSVYAGVAEVSVYIADSARGKGVGRTLLIALIEESERNGVWTLQAGILSENIASIELHKGCGFREVGMRERLGRLHGLWRDVILLERRSRTVGID
jgi:L-amino acid N-acyltransferase YncA